jgi:hypothetical protein
MGAWEPVRITGFPKLLIIKLSAELVYARLSVPCRITKASNN